MVSTLTNKLDGKTSRGTIVSKKPTSFGKNRSHNSTLSSLSSSSEMIKQGSQHIINDTVDQTLNITQSLMENKEFVQNSYSNIQSLSNPLIAPPSIFATSIFAQLQDTLALSNDLITFELYTAGSNNNGFAFDDQSPDDIVLNARSQKGTGAQKGIFDFYILSNIPILNPLVI